MRLFKTKKPANQQTIMEVTKDIIQQIDAFVFSNGSNEKNNWDCKLILYATFYMVGKANLIADNELEVLSDCFVNTYPSGLKREYHQFFINFCNEINSEFRIQKRKDGSLDTYMSIIRIGLMHANFPKELFKNCPLEKGFKIAIAQIKTSQ